MTNLQITKRALCSSAIALLVCFTMLLGTTFAWFTDSVTSNDNIIQTGTLDVQLLMYNGNEYVDISESDKPIFGENGLIAENEDVDILWEPGKTQIVYLGVKNAGSLALKYNVLVDVEDQGLVGALDYAIIDGATKEDADALGIASWSDVLAVDGVQTGLVQSGRTAAANNGALEADGYDYFALAVHMQETAGNEYQDKNIVIDINVVATQLSSESDSFGSDYDADAEYPVVKLPPKNVEVTSVDDLKAALTEAANGEQEMIIDATGLTLEITEVMANGSAAATEIPAGVTIKGATFSPTHRGGNYILMSAGANEQVVFENCIFDNAGKNLVIGSTVDGPDSVIYNNCTFTGSVITNFVDNPDGVAEFNGCTFKKATSGIVSRSFVEGMGGIHNFNNCTFDFTGVTQSSMGVITSGCVNVYSESGYSTTVVLNGCTRTNCGTRTYGPNSTLTIK